MRTVGMKRGAAAPLFVFLLAAASHAGADDWAAPRTREAFSESREYFVRVIPGRTGRHALAEFYRRDAQRSYRLTAEATLLNPVAPVEFFVSNDGHLATVDNWHNLGYGKVVAIYDSLGRVVRGYELAELFQPKEVEDFAHSVSSIHWRKGPVYVRHDQKTLLVTVKSGSDFLFGLQTGRFKFCEPHDKTFRCRSSNEPREWQPGSKVSLTR